jgi:hypothetical protein
MPEYQITFTLRDATVTVKSSGPVFIDKWWNAFKPIITLDPIPYPEKTKNQITKNPT